MMLGKKFTEQPSDINDVRYMGVEGREKIDRADGSTVVRYISPIRSPITQPLESLRPLLNMPALLRQAGILHLHGMHRRNSSVKVITAIKD